MLYTRLKTLILICLVILVSCREKGEKYLETPRHVVLVRPEVSLPPSLDRNGTGLSKKGEAIPITKSVSPLQNQLTRPSITVGTKERRRPVRIRRWVESKSFPSFPLSQGPGPVAQSRVQTASWWEKDCKHLNLSSSAKDSDQDGIPDGCEEELGLNPCSYQGVAVGAYFVRYPLIRELILAKKEDFSIKAYDELIAEEIHYERFAQLMGNALDRISENRFQAVHQILGQVKGIELPVDSLRSLKARLFGWPTNKKSTFGVIRGGHHEPLIASVRKDITMPIFPISQEELVVYAAESFIRIPQGAAVAFEPLNQEERVPILVQIFQNGVLQFSSDRNPGFQKERIQFELSPTGEEGMDHFALVTMMHKSTGHKIQDVARSVWFDIDQNGQFERFFPQRVFQLAPDDKKDLFDGPDFFSDVSIYAKVGGCEDAPVPVKPIITQGIHIEFKSDIPWNLQRYIESLNQLVRYSGGYSEIRKTLFKIIQSLTFNLPTRQDQDSFVFGFTPDEIREVITFMNTQEVQDPDKKFGGPAPYLVRYSTWGYDPCKELEEALEQYIASQEGEEGNVPQCRDEIGPDKRKKRQEADYENRP